MNGLLQYLTWEGIGRHWKALGGVAACIYNPPLLLKGRTLTTTLIFPPPAGAMMGGYEDFSLGQCLVYRMDIVGGATRQATDMRWVRRVRWVRAGNVAGEVTVEVPR